MKHLLFITYLVVFSNGFSQNDSLLRVYNNLKMHDTLRLDALSWLSSNLVSNNPDSSILLSRIQIDMAKRLNKGVYVSYGYNTLGTAQRNKGENAEALKSYQSALENSKAINHLPTIGNSYNNIAIIHLKYGDFDRALAINFETIEMYKKQKNANESIIKAYNNIGIIYAQQKDYPKSKKYLKMALALLKTNKNQVDYGNCLNNLGNIARREDKLDEALIFHKKALQVRQNIKDQRGIATSYTNIGNIYGMKKQFKEALKFQFLSLTMMKKLNDPENVAGSYYTIGSLFLEQKEYAKASFYFDSAQLLGKNYSDKELKIKLYKNMALLNFETDSFQKAYLQLKASSDLKSELFGLSEINKFNRVSTKQELLEQKLKLNIQKELEKKYLNKQFNWLMTFSLITLLFLIIGAFQFIKSKKQAQQIAKQNSTLVLLNKDLIHSEENLTEANEAKEFLLSLMSHDLMGSFRTTSDYIQLINKNKEEFDLNTLKNAVEKINTSIIPVQEMMHQFLQWSYSNLEKTTPKLENINLSELIQNELNVQLNTTLAKGISFQKTMDESLSMNTDKLMMESIVRNLISNAIKFAPLNSKIKIDFKENKFSIENQTAPYLKETIEQNNEPASTLGTAGEKGYGLGVKLTKICVAKLGLEMQIERLKESYTTVVLLEK